MTVRKGDDTLMVDPKEGAGANSGASISLEPKMPRQATLSHESPHATVDFGPGAGCVIGVDLGGTKCHGVLADFAGTTLHEDLRPTKSAGSPLGTLINVIDSLRATAEGQAIPVEAVAIGVPAIVDPDTGVATGGANVGWQDFPINAELATHMTVPFVVQNDVRLAALAHAWRGDGRASSDFAVLSIGTGIGAALVMDGRLVRGHHNAAGEVGFLLLNRSQVRGFKSVETGGFERLASGPAIAVRAKKRIASSAVPTVLRDGPVTTERVFAAAEGGDLIANKIVDEACDHIGMGIVALSTICDLELVILEGSVGRALQP
ncbi:MAG: ROK family protein, partial [bacterium]